MRYMLNLAIRCFFQKMLNYRIKSTTIVRKRHIYQQVYIVRKIMIFWKKKKFKIIFFLIIFLKKKKLKKLKIDTWSHSRCHLGHIRWLAMVRNKIISNSQKSYLLSTFTMSLSLWHYLWSIVRTTIIVYIHRKKIDRWPLHEITSNRVTIGSRTCAWSVSLYRWSKWQQAKAGGTLRGRSSHTLLNNRNGTTVVSVPARLLLILEQFAGPVENGGWSRLTSGEGHTPNRDGSGRTRLNGRFHETMERAVSIGSQWL